MNGLSGLLACSDANLQLNVVSWQRVIANSSDDYRLSLKCRMETPREIHGWEISCKLIHDANEYSLRSLDFSLSIGTDSAHAEPSDTKPAEASMGILFYNPFVSFYAPELEHLDKEKDKRGSVSGAVLLKTDTAGALERALMAQADFDVAIILTVEARTEPTQKSLVMKYGHMDVSYRWADAKDNPIRIKDVSLMFSKQGSPNRKSDEWASEEIATDANSLSLALEGVNVALAQAFKYIFGTLVIIAILLGLLLEQLFRFPNLR